jgi:PH and SEC7 domain-containing protein
MTVLGVVHAVSYSLLLLNTDLHVAELSTRMSRNQFVRNTIAAIQMQVQPTPLSEVSVTDLTYDDCGSVRTLDATETAVGTTTTRSNRSGSVTSWNSVSRDALTSTTGGISSTVPISGRPSNGSTPSIQVSGSQEPKQANSNGTSMSYGRVWENDMENLLKVTIILS